LRLERKTSAWRCDFLITFAALSIFAVQNRSSALFLHFLDYILLISGNARTMPDHLGTDQRKTKDAEGEKEDKEFQGMFLDDF
jgi:hypothetical protein